MRVDQNLTFTNQFSFSRPAGSPSSDSFSAALDLSDRQPQSEVDDGDDTIVHGTLTESRSSASTDTTSSLLEELSKWAHMSPAEKIRAQWLGAHGMTEDSFSQLSSEEQAAINKQIAEEVKRQLADESDSTQVALG